MTLTANLIRVAPNMMEGVLTGHPVKTLVRLQELATAERGIGLWDGSTLVGVGVLRCADGVWNGSCTEHAGKWRVSGGDDALTFEELR
jgi:hypothetical protein